MAWTASNWITYTGQARLDQLRAHIKEVADAITAGVSSDGTQYNPATLTPYMDGLMKTEANIASQLVGGVFGAPTRRRPY